MALKGIRVIELAGLAPAPFCGMILSDFGADVIRVQWPSPRPEWDMLARGKRSINLNLKAKGAQTVFLKLAEKSDVLIEPFRKGVMEKLQLGPDLLMKRNPRLIYARLTGYGQHGCLSDRAGHDINYISIAGILSTLGRKDDNPLPPINLLADFGGGGLMCALGICMALFERSKSGFGQVIDANMVQGAAYLASFLWRSRQLEGCWGYARGQNMLDSGSHFYNTYKTKDGKYIAVGALEPAFYEPLLKGLGLTEEEVPHFDDFENGKKKFASVFATKTQAEWTDIFKDVDACVTPILGLDEAPLHPHNQSYNTFMKGENGFNEPAPAPLLSRTPAKPKMNELVKGQHTVEILTELGYNSDDINKLLRDNIAGTAELSSKL